VTEPRPDLPNRRLALESAAIMALAALATFAIFVLNEAAWDGAEAGRRAVERFWQWAALTAAAGAVVGYWTGLFHQKWIADDAASPANRPLPVEGREGVLRLGILRFFSHLPFYLGPSLFGMVWAALSRGDLVQRGSGIVPIWFQVGPLMLSWPVDGDFPGTPPTLPRLAHGLLRWAWCLPVMLIVAARGGEIYGEPEVLLPAGTWWVGDYLVLWWVLRARVR
jgi:hypothetical protein